MIETFVASVAKRLTIVKGKDDSEDWIDDRQEDIITCIENTGNSADMIIDNNISADGSSLNLYFLTNLTEKIGTIETDRPYPMHPGEMFIGSTIFDDMVSSTQYADLFKSGEALKIISVIHDDRINSIVYEVRKYIKSKNDKLNMTINLDDYEFFDSEDGESEVRAKGSKEGNVVSFPSMYFPDPEE